MMPNRPEYVAIWFGLVRAGLGVALVNTNLTGAGLAHSLDVVAAKAVIVDAALADAFRDARRRATPVYFYGEGRSGEPRLDLEIAAFSDKPLDAAETAGADAHRSRALHLHFRHDGPAEGGAHHPFAGAAHHARLRRGDRRAGQRPRLHVPADVSHQRRRHRAGPGARRRRLRLYPREILGERVLERLRAREMHAVRLYRRTVPLSHEQPRRGRRSASTRSAPASATACGPTSTRRSRSASASARCWSSTARPKAMR